MSQKTVETKKLIGFSKPMLDALKEEKGRLAKARGKATEKDVIEALLVGKETFMPSVEAWIAQRMQETGGTRSEVIQLALWEVIQARRKKRGAKPSPPAEGTPEQT